jgi:hypothetical protein
MSKSAEDEVNLTAADGILPILAGTTEDQPPLTVSDPKEEALPSTPKPAMEDTIMREAKQSTPEAEAKEETLPVSTPDLNTGLLDGPLVRCINHPARTMTATLSSTLTPPPATKA